MTTLIQKFRLLQNTDTLTIQTVSEHWHTLTIQTVSEHWHTLTIQTVSEQWHNLTIPASCTLFVLTTHFKRRANGNALLRKAANCLLCILLFAMFRKCCIFYFVFFLVHIKVSFCSLHSIGTPAPHSCPIIEHSDNIG